MRKNVSIPLWFSRNVQFIAWYPDRVNVSIPLWFSRNDYGFAEIEDTSTFPYHYGSHATRILEAVSLTDAFMFPYHYGSHATSNPRPYFIRRYKQFPYHYGSHATNCRLKSLRNGTAKKVSIPLWFSRNWTIMATPGS